MVNIPCAEAGCERSWSTGESARRAYNAVLPTGWWADGDSNYWCPDHRVKSASYMLRNASTPKNPLPPVSREDVNEWLELADVPLKLTDHLPPEHDAVSHPSHYTSHPSGVECIQVTEWMNFNIGNAVKYLWRAGGKGDAVEDLKKAAWYVQREITRLETS